MGAARLDDLAWWWYGGPVILPVCLPQGLSAQNTGIDSPVQVGQPAGVEGHREQVHAKGEPTPATWPDRAEPRQTGWITR